ncbi:MAG TPA: hypothetical protein DEG43_00035 [Acidimicrobiaceae bacterium]|jgi:hypothetical protein|nr:hypothetical protein [Acidimicrobiaceae bacterium]
MLRFFSPEWFSEVRRIAAAISLDPPTPDRLDVHCSILDAAGGLCHGLFSFDGAQVLVVGPEAAPIESSDPDSPRLSLDSATARAVQDGSLSIRSAFLAGRIQLGGDVQRLTSSQLNLNALGDIFGEVRRSLSSPSADR